MLEKLLNPKSVVIIGAAREEGKVGRVILDNIIEAGFKGAIYPVNPKADKIHGIKSYPSILKIKQDIDVAIIVTPALTVPPLIDEVGQKQVKNAVIISAGFKETGLEGAKLEKEVLKRARKYGIRVLGPNCLGYINSAIGLNASFTRVGPLKGGISFISQSGALQTAILDWSREIDLGFAKFISLGNKSDLDEEDFIKNLANDKKTSVICLYIEGISDGSSFLKNASKVAKRKPIIALKAGRTNAGAKAVSSHTGTLAGSKNAYTAAFRQTGIIQANTLRQMFDYARVLSKKPLPKGNRLGIVTNAGGPAILASDYTSNAALTMPSLTTKTIKKLGSFLPAAANIYNPVDVLGDAKSNRYEKALSLLAKDPNVDSVLVILTPQAMSEIEKTAEIVSKIAKKSRKPIITSFMGGMEIKTAVKILSKNNMVNYTYPEDAVKAIGSLVTFSKIKKRPSVKYSKFSIDSNSIRKIIKKAQNEQRVNLSYLEANDVLKAVGINVPKSLLARSEEEVLRHVKKLNFPVALKIVSPEILHKTDIGGVKLNINDTDELTSGYFGILDNAKRFMPQAHITGVLVQEMVQKGEETIVGMSRDPQFGPLMLFGLGGIYVETLKDVSFRIAPLNIMDVRKMLAEVKSYLILKGIRGKKAKDIISLEKTMLKVSQLVTEFRELVEMDINPLMVKENGKGVVAADARISISL